ncbi:MULTISPECIES: GyrI-like domain-containing protein [Rummeliibacillus]|jgi:Uncharacterized protein conserved in bacteria|uniref:GyrI-like domain-containing protein n=1 Tax=Rummeliibacillus TaxID=648802 RepID=UPI0011B6CDD6|nr:MULTISPECIES: GyrI-like domain-containing protein [Rummeliibacillus]
MFARFEEIDGFIVKGYAINNGQHADVPMIRNKLKQELDNMHVCPKTTYGVYTSMGDEGLHYVAGIVSHMVKELNATDQVLVAAGRYLVGIVEHGIEDIPASIEALLNVKGITFRHAPCFEKYLFGEEVEQNEIEIWVPIQ